jgi:hypothetical protein
MDPNRKLWNDRHQNLNRALSKGDRDTAIELFLDQHAMIHSAKVSKSKLWSFEDELLDDLTEAEIRQIPAGGEHSVAWILLHLARIEDITMNMLVAGTEQLFTRDGWAKKLNISVLHSANRMDAASVAELSAGIDIKSLRAYRAAVGKRTRAIVRKLQAQDFKQKVDPARLESVLRQGAVSPEAMEIVEYWSKKTIAGLLLMPPTRHCILHFNEGMRIKELIRMGESRQ